MKIQNRTNIMTSNNHFLVATPGYPNFKLNFNFAKLSQFFMSESTTNILLDWMDDMREEIYESSNRFKQEQTMLYSATPFWEVFSMDPNTEKCLNSVSFKVWKHFNNSFYR